MTSISLSELELVQRSLPLALEAVGCWLAQHFPSGVTDSGKTLLAWSRHMHFVCTLVSGLSGT